MKRTRAQRARAIVAKRPTITVVATHVPDVVAREQLLDLLVELLDERARSGQG